MSIVAFDTLKFVEKLESGGFSHAQARVTAQAFADATSEQIATKADDKESEMRLEAKIETIKSDLKADIAETKADILKWMFGTIGFQTLVIVSAIFIRPNS